MVFEAIGSGTWSTVSLKIAIQGKNLAITGRWTRHRLRTNVDRGGGKTPDAVEPSSHEGTSPDSETRINTMAPAHPTFNLLPPGCSSLTPPFTTSLYSAHPPNSRI